MASIAFMQCVLLAVRSACVVSGYIIVHLTVQLFESVNGDQTRSMGKALVWVHCAAQRGKGHWFSMPVPVALCQLVPPVNGRQYLGLA